MKKRSGLSKDELQKREKTRLRIAEWRRMNKKFAEGTADRAFVVKAVGRHLNGLAKAIPSVPVDMVYRAMENQLGGISVELLEELEAISDWVGALRDLVKLNAVSCSRRLSK